VRPPGSPVGFRGIGTDIVMWPVGYPAFGPEGGPPAYVANLASGRLVERAVGIGAGDYQPLAVPAGRFLVYVGNGTEAVSAQLTAAPRLLGSTPVFAPAASASHVWLEYSNPHSDVLTIRLVAVTGGPPGASLRLPSGTRLLAGMRSGLLLVNGDGLAELWQPGAAPRLLPGDPYFEYGVATTSLLVAYGAGCRDEITSPGAALGDAGYYACSELNVLNVETGVLESFRSPPGTRGWVPDEFNVVNASSPSNTAIAAYAVSSRYSEGRVRLFLVPLRRRESPPIAVPNSTALLYARIAWSADGNWLFYQGPRSRLAAYEPASGRTLTSDIPCCRYTVMFGFPSSP